MILIGVVSAASWTENLNADLKIYLTMNETSGDQFYDSVNGINVTLNDTHIDGIIGKGFGNTSSRTWGNTTISHLGEITISSWVWRTGETNNYYLCSYHAGSEEGSVCWVMDTNEKMNFYAHDGSVLASTGTIDIPTSPELWTITVNDTSLTRYINGTHNTTIALDGSFPAYGGAIYIGGSSQGANKGTGANYDEFAIWNRVLTDSEIEALYNSGSGITYKKFQTITENSQTFNTPVSTLTEQTYSINITYNSTQFTSIIGNLHYNNTVYSGAKTGANDNAVFTRTLTAPFSRTQVNKTFYWAFQLTNSSGTHYANSTSQTQTINVFGIDNCSSYSNNLFNISLFDEGTQGFLDGNIQNTSIKIDFDIKSTSDGSLISNYSTFYNQTNPAKICMNNLLGDSRYRLDGIIEYKSDNRFQEFYNFQNFSLTNSSTNKTIFLYNLLSADGQEFKVTFKDSNFVTVEGAILDIQRRYVDEGVFKTVERPKTGAEGYTIAHLVRNDVLYNIIVKKEGVILATFEDVVADCQNPTLKSCEINLNSYGTSSFPGDFSTNNDITFTLTYNTTSKKISSVFTIKSGATAIVSLNVTKFDALGVTQVCSDIITAAGGALSCTIPASFGNSTVIAQLYKDGTEVGFAIIRQKQNPSDIYGGSIITLAIVVFLVIVGIGASSDNPMTMGIAIVIGSIVLIGLNIVYTPTLYGVGATILWFIIAIALLLIKGSGRS